MKRFLIMFVVLSLAVGWVAPAHSAAAPELTKLTASDGTASELFGIGVAVSGDTAVVGAPQKAAPSPVEGAAYVFTRSGGAWTEQAKLVPSDGAAADRFGQAVAMSGDTVVVGAFWHDKGVNLDQGAAYVFTRSGGTWTEQAKLTASDGSKDDQFGFSVAVSGDTAVIGAPSDDQGSAYVFTRAGGSWTEQTKLVGSDAAPEDSFGERVAISGNTAVVGGSGDDVDGKDGQGSAYVFIRSGQTWTEQAKLTASDGAAGDQFGFWVSVSGDTAVLGAFMDDVGTNLDQGSAYVFSRDGQTWTEQAKLTASDGAATDQFARSVAVSGHKVVAGAQSDDVDGKAGQGSAYVFTRSTGTWSEQARLVAQDGAAGDTFGVSVGLSGDTAIVGSGFAQVGANPAQGAAYVTSDSTPPAITDVVDKPDPFRPTADARRFTTIAFTLSERAAVTLMIFNREGRLVRSLLKGESLSRDRHSVRWNGLSNDGRKVKPGKYAYRIKAVDAAGNKSSVVTGTVVVRR
jgi:hypothetical protein